MILTFSTTVCSIRQERMEFWGWKIIFEIKSFGMNRYFSAYCRPSIKELCRKVNLKYLNIFWFEKYISKGNWWCISPAFGDNILWLCDSFIIQTEVGKALELSNTSWVMCTSWVRYNKTLGQLRPGVSLCLRIKLFNWRSRRCWFKLSLLHQWEFQAVDITKARPSHTMPI